MSAELIGVIGILILFVFLVLRMWVGVGMCLVGMLGILAVRSGGQALNILGSTPFSTTSNYSLTVIPMFVLMGLVISESGMGTGLFSAANAFIGHRRGGLASSTVVASGLLGAITGSHMAGTIIMSKIALPEMRRYHYNDELACGSIAGGAPLAIIIPPSIPMIMYGIIAEENIGKLFIAGIIPGLLLVLIDMLMISIVTARNPDYGPAGQKFSWKERLQSLRGVWPMIVLFLLVLGGIYGGWFTVTESGAIGAAGAILLGVLNRSLTVKQMIKCLVNAAQLTSTILLMMIGTNVFISFISVSKLPFLLTRMVTGLAVPVGVIILLVALIYIILGMFMPDNPMIMLTVPILYPIMVTGLGLNGIWFGIFVVLMTALGSITPPVGMVVFLLGGLSKVDVSRIFKGVIPFVLGIVLVIVLISIFPGIVTWLPSMM
ncbi:MAG: TRAP transporter large permease [Oscillospiraceae bacterium]|nr:TRAP transporter large permease [Oscillospiraceae bacterium]